MCVWGGTLENAGGGVSMVNVIMLTIHLQTVIFPHSYC